MQDVRLYESVTNSLSVGALVEVLPIFPEADWTVEQAFEELVNVDLTRHDLFVVRELDVPVGYIDFFEALDTELRTATLREVMEAISPGQIISNSTPILDAIQLFDDDRQFFFVLRGNQLDAVLSWRDLDKLPAKLCLFGLVMELEFALTAVLRDSEEVVANLLQVLSEARIEKAKQLFALKYGERTLETDALLLCTTLIDKVNIALKFDAICKRLPFGSARDARRFFVAFERLRNSLAHGDSVFSVVADAAALNALVRQALAVVDALLEEAPSR